MLLRAEGAPSRLRSVSHRCALPSRAAILEVSAKKKKDLQYYA